MTAPFRCPRHGTAHDGIEACSRCADDRRIWSVVRQVLATSRQSKIPVGEVAAMGAAMRALLGRQIPGIVLEEVRYQLRIWPRDPLPPAER